MSRVDNLELLLEDQIPVELNDEEREKLSKASTLSEFYRQKLEKDNQKNWNLFYRRNGDRFFKNRHWTKREFHELFNLDKSTPKSAKEIKYLLEIGCGCGDFVLPLLESNSALIEDSQDGTVTSSNNLFFYCCDIAETAINILKSKPLYIRSHPQNIKAFVADITDDVESIKLHLDGHYMDFVSLIFVISALDPIKMKQCIGNIYEIMKPGGLVVFRDYAIYDKAMLRFHENSKICDQFYVRQDGTRAYFFSKKQLLDLFEDCHLHCQSIDYVMRETVNQATKDKFSRIFLQAKFIKY